MEKMDEQNNTFEAAPVTFIDVDRTILEPSPQRVRNILTLEERVRAIQAYDCRPMYTKVAKMFNCSWEQIKNIIANREAIMEFYKATKAVKPSDPHQDEIRERKTSFLGECVYEYIQRVQYHTKVDITEELIRSKALEFRDAIQMEHFVPNRSWMNSFKATYNFSLSNRQILLTRKPPPSLETKHIMTYCSKNKAKDENESQFSTAVQPISNLSLYRAETQLAAMNANMAVVEELKQRQKRKISFLEKALYEYTQRSLYHKRGPLTELCLVNVARALKDMLKIDDFVANKTWFNYFINRFDLDLSACSPNLTRTPPLSLDLKDILSYCSRHENVSPQPKTQQSSQVRGTIIISKRTASDVESDDNNDYDTQNSGISGIKQELIDLIEDENFEAADVKPDIFKLECNVLRDVDELSTQPPLKMRRIEEMTVKTNNFKNNSSTEKNNGITLRPTELHSYKNALEYLKPLEEFAMLRDEFRMIGLLSQIEGILKTQLKNGKQK